MPCIPHLSCPRLVASPVTHRLDDDGYDDPREALKFEAGRAPEVQRKKRESKNRWAAFVRASHGDSGFDERLGESTGRDE